MNDRRSLILGMAIVGLVSAGSLFIALYPHAAMLDSAPAPAETKANSTPNKAKSVLIQWVGDLTPGSRYGLPPSHGKGQLSGVASHLRSADLTIGNLEGTLTNGGSDKCHGSPNCYSFRAPPGWVEGMRWAGFDLMNLANNHAFDFAGEGQRQTIQTLRKAGIHYSGLPGQITVINRNGLRVALVGFAPYPWAASLTNSSSAANLVKRASHQADLVVVMIHAGAEGSDRGHVPKGTEYAFGENRGNSREFTHRMIRAGADLVVGSGPHVVRGMEWYRGRLIAYSAGNFAGWHNFGLGGNLSESALLRVRLESSGRWQSGRWMSVWIREPGYPVLDSSARSARHANGLSRTDLGHSAVLVGANGTIQIP